MALNSAAIIVAHSHPSGSPQASPDDIKVNKALVKAGHLLQIEVPPGEHEVSIVVRPAPVQQRPKKPFSIDDLPSHDLGPWPEGLSLRRKDIYGDDGR